MNKLLVFVFSTLLTVIFVIFLMSFVCILMILRKEEEPLEGEETDYQLYQFLTRNIMSNEISYDFVPLLNDLDEHEFIFKDDGEEQILLSNLGEEQYQCFGSCSCNNEEYRRNTAVLTRSFSYLVVAITSLFAINLAEEYFKKKCAEEMISYCEEKNVRSTVNDCTYIKHSSYNDDTIEAPPNHDSTENEESDKFSETKTFWCIGKCMKRPGRVWELLDGEEKKNALKINCHQFNLEKKIVVSGPSAEEYRKESFDEVRDIKNFYTPWLPDKEQSKCRPSAFYYFYAIKKFRNLYLQKFCLENSLIDVSRSFNNKKDVVFKKGKVGVCASPDQIRRTNIKCKQQEKRDKRWPFRDSTRIPFDEK